MENKTAPIGYAEAARALAKKVDFCKAELGGPADDGGRFAVEVIRTTYADALTAIYGATFDRAREDISDAEGGE